MAVKVLRLGRTGQGAGIGMRPKWNRTVCDGVVFVPGTGGISRHADNTG